MLRHLPRTSIDPNLLVGLDTSDDAGVYRLNDQLALVQTVDFFTPVVDDPYMFGQIAAANALSDLYAMGADPLTVLNIVGFPVKKLDKSILAEILRGAGDKIAEAGATLVGGHSIDDPEPKFGLACTGVIHPEKVRKNVGAQPGDRLVLTKPIGVGIYTTAIKRDLLTAQEIEQVSQVMATLNKTAAKVLDDFDVHACTDVTGFGLLGHAAEMAKGSGVGFTLSQSRIPILPRTRELAEAGAVPGGTKANHRWLKDCVVYDPALDEVDQWILCDAITSGGLLVALPENQVEEVLTVLQQHGVNAAEIGSVISDHPGCIQVNQ